MMKDGGQWIGLKEYLQETGWEKSCWGSERRCFGGWTNKNLEMSSETPIQFVGWPTQIQEYEPRKEGGFKPQMSEMGIWTR